MFARSFLIVLGLVVIANIATAYNFIDAIRILQRAFPWAKFNCLHQAANMCMFQHNEQQVIMCGGQWLQSNKGKCMMFG